MPNSVIDSTTRSTSAPLHDGANKRLEGDVKQYTPALLCILASVSMLLFTFALCWAKFSRAEVFFAECAREMIAQSNYVTPLYHSKPFFDKPILIYWLIIGMYKAFGVSHFVARVPSMVAAIAAIAGTAAIGRRLDVQKKNMVALIGAMCVGSSFMFFSFGYLCMSDMFLVMFDILSLALLYAGANNAAQRDRLWWFASISMGFAFTTKGPIGIVLPGIALVAYLAITKNLRAVKFTHFLYGGLTAALIAVPWFYAAYLANGVWALKYFFIGENLQRYTGSVYDTHKPVWFMVTSLITGFLPWSIFLPGAFVDFVGDIKQKFATEGGKQRLFLWIWTAVVTAFFSFSRGKCDYYVLPVYPAVALLVASHLSSKFDQRWPKTLACIMGGVFVIAGLASPLVLSKIAMDAPFTSWWIMPVSLAACGAIALYGALKLRATTFVAGVFLAICLAGSGFAFQLLPAINQSQSFNVYAAEMRKVPMSTKVAVHTSLGHWVDELTFQVERDPVELSSSQTVSDLFMSGPAVALIPEEKFNLAVQEKPELQSLKFHIIDRRQVSSHPLTPGYVLKRKGNLFDTTLLLVAN